MPWQETHRVAPGRGRSGRVRDQGGGALAGHRSTYTGCANATAKPMRGRSTIHAMPPRPLVRASQSEG
jgi:hypothetical protein